MKKHSDLAFKIRKKNFSRCFTRKLGTICLNNEKRIIYAEKRVNNFLNNAEQKTILCRILEIVYAENSEQFYYIQKTNFMNAIRIFEYTINMMCREQILLM